MRIALSVPFSKEPQNPANAVVLRALGGSSGSMFSVPRHAYGAWRIRSGGAEDPPPWRTFLDNHVPDLASIGSFTSGCSLLGSSIMVVSPSAGIATVVVCNIVPATMRSKRRWGAGSCLLLAPSWAYAQSPAPRGSNANRHQHMIPPSVGGSPAPSARRNAMRRIHIPAISTGTALLLLFAHSAAADVITIGASKDNTLYEDSSGSLSNGAGKRFFAGLNDSGEIRRGLIEFDVAGSIPAGSNVTAVSLSLYMSRTKAGSETVRLHLLFAEWGEAGSIASGEEGGGASALTGDATWLHTFYPSSFWSSPGAAGDFASTASASMAVDKEGFYTWSSAQMAADVQAWLMDPSLNHGWIVIGAEPAGGQKTSKRFESRQSNDLNRRPQLTITFDPPGGSTGACCFFDGTCSVLDPTTCSLQGGVYQGDGTSCTPNPCPQPTGACCLPNGTCIDTDSTSCASQGGTYQGDGVPCSPNPCPLALTPFQDQLPIPSVAVPTSGSAGGVATYDMAMTQFQQKLHKDLPATTVWGYGGSFPGPTIEASSGLQVTVTWKNDLRDAQGNLLSSHYLPVDPCPHGASDDSPRTVVHLHGGHVPAAVDGYPESTFLPGNQVVYAYPNNQDASTLWYHDHALGITRLNVYMGLAGLYLVRDAFELSLNLPSGEFEVPLAIQDRTFSTDGTLSYPASWQQHFFGEFFLVNGKVWPYLRVKQGKYRFRLLNGCNSRTLDLALSDGATFWVIGNEGGLIDAPVPVTNVVLGPGERYDVVIDFEPYGNNTNVELVNSAPAPYPGTPGVGVIAQVMQFQVTNQSGDTDPLPTTLRPVPPLNQAGAVQRTLELKKDTDPCAGSIWTINGLRWDDITERPQLGDTEIWSFVNRSGIMHPMHMHLVFFQVLDRQPFTEVGGTIVTTGPPVPPAPEEMGWKDTAKVGPNEILRVIARFTDYKGLYAYHCHILEHEDHEMMRQFEVVDPVIAYCTAKSALVCGTPSISGSGVPSATASSGFMVSAGPARSCRSGILLYNTAAQIPTGPYPAFGGPGSGVLCVPQSGVRRAAPTESGGTPGSNCDGIFAIDMNAFNANTWVATGCNPPLGQTNPAGFLDTPGNLILGQMWGRDSIATGQFLSDGIAWFQGP